MARGRKPTTMNRNDRYLGSYNYDNSNGSFVTDELELAEEDIWSPAVMHDTETDESYGAWNLRSTLGKSGRVGGLTLAFKGSSGAPQSSPMNVQQIHVGGEEEGGEIGRKLASSAPVNVPDWSKIYRVDSVESIQELNNEEDEDEEESGMMPPHEYLAKSQARRNRKTGGGGASVFEGVGRTLKGRELRRVRDAIWSQTGFYG